MLNSLKLLLRSLYVDDPNDIMAAPSPALNILSLPDELLVGIFEAVHPGRPASSSGDIASLRLVSRRFAACSSHLLVPYVRLDGIVPESLARLEEISHHPTISKGVRTVRLVARFYTPTLAADLRQFAWYAVNTVFGRALRYREAFDEEENGVDTDDPVDVLRMIDRREECAEVLENVKAALRTWSRVPIDNGVVEDLFAAGGPPSSWDVDLDKSDQEYIALRRRRDSGSGERDETEKGRHMQLLRLAHATYRLRYQKQEMLRRDGAFVRRFAASMARMPRAKSLEIYDFAPDDDDDNITAQDGSDNDGEPNVFSPYYEYDGLINTDALVRPMSWDEATDRNLGDPPAAEVLFGLPIAIQRSGAHLDSISVKTSTSAERYYPLLRSSAAARDLGLAVSHMRLKSFIFLHQEGLRARGVMGGAGPSLGGVQAFDDFISAMTNSDALERLWLRLDGGCMWSSDGDLDREPGYRFGLGSLLSSSPESYFDSNYDFGPPLARGGGLLPWRDSLRDIHLSDIAVHLSDLQCLADQLRILGTRLDILTLRRVHLLSGTWAEALEILRTVEVEYEKEIAEPQGAECDDVTMMLGGRYDVVFGRSDGVRTLADEFINGDTKQNPLRDNYTVEMAYLVDGEEVLVEVTVGNETEDILEWDNTEVNPLVSLIASQIV